MTPMRASVTALFMSLVLACGAKGGTVPRASAAPGLWELEKGTGYAIELYGVLSAATGEGGYSLQIGAELWAKGSARVTEKTASLACIRLVLEEREIAFRSSQALVQKQLEQSVVPPPKGSSVDLWFDAQSGRLDSWRYRGVRSSCGSGEADFAALIAFPNLRNLARPLPFFDINALGATRATLIARGIEQALTFEPADPRQAPQGAVITNQIRLESEDGRGARGGITTWQAYRLSPGRPLAAWASADFETRTSFPGTGLKMVLPLAWHIEYVCRYTAL